MQQARTGPISGICERARFAGCCSRVATEESCNRARPFVGPERVQLSLALTALRNFFGRGCSLIFCGMTESHTQLRSRPSASRLKVPLPTQINAILLFDHARCTRQRQL